MRLTLVAIVAVLVVAVACGDSKPPMVPDNPDLSGSPEGGAPSSSANVLPVGQLSHALRY